MGDTIGQNPSGGESSSDKLKDLKKFIENNKSSVPDIMGAQETVESVEGLVDMAQKLFEVKDLIDKAMEYVDIDIDLMEHLEDIKSMLVGIQGVAKWLKNSGELEYVLETVEDLLYYIDMAISAIKLLKDGELSIPRRTELRAKLKEALTEISNIIDKAIEAIDFVKKLQEIDLKNLSLDMSTFDKLKGLIE